MLILLGFQSALLGGVVGVVGMSWVSLKAQWAVASGAMVYETKPLTVEHCDYKFDSSALVSALNSTVSTEAAE